MGPWDKFWTALLYNRLPLSLSQSLEQRERVSPPPPVAIVSCAQLIETDKEGPANSKEMPEFEFGLVGQLS